MPPTLHRWRWLHNGEGGEGIRPQGGRYHLCIVNLKSCTQRCADVKPLAKASGGAAIETAGLDLCSCNYDLSHFTSVVLVFTSFINSQPGQLCFYYFLTTISFFFPAILSLSMKIMFEVYFQVLCPGKLLGLDPKMQTAQLMVLTGNIISDPCS